MISGVGSSGGKGPVEGLNGMALRYPKLPACLVRSFLGEIPVESSSGPKTEEF